MSRNHRLIRSTMNDLLMDTDFTLTKPLIEIYDQQRVLIEHHCGIIDYGCGEISVRVSFGSICVCGENLMLRLLSKDKVVITGGIRGVTLHRGSQR